MRAGFYLAFACLVPSASLAETVTNPSNEALQAIYQHLSGSAPDFETQARRSKEFNSADPFSKKKVLQAQIDRLEADFERLGNIDTLIIPLGVRFGEYDFDVEGFPTGLSSTSFIDTQPRIYPINVGDFTVFKVEDEEQARNLADVLDDYGTSIEFTLTSLAVSLNDSRAIESKISGAKIISSDGKILGELKPREESSASTLNGSDVETVKSDISSFAGLPMVGLRADEAIAILKKSYPVVIGKAGSREAKGDIAARVGYNPEFGGKSGDVAHVAFGHVEDQLRASLEVTGGSDESKIGGSKFVWSRFGENTDCGTDVVGDSCGLAEFTMVDGRLLLTGLVAMRDSKTINLVDNAIEFAGPLAKSMQTRSAASQLSNTNNAIRFAYAGEAVAESQRLLAHAPNFPSDVSAPVSIMSVQIERERTASILSIFANPAKHPTFEPFSYGEFISREPFTTSCRMGYCAWTMVESATLRRYGTEEVPGRLLSVETRYAEIDAGTTPASSDWSELESSLVFCSSRRPAIQAGSDESMFGINMRGGDSAIMDSARTFYERVCHPNDDFSDRHNTTLRLDMLYTEEVEYPSVDALLTP